jgi:hypothetical protein
MSDLDLQAMMKAEALAVSRVSEEKKVAAADYLRGYLCGVVPQLRNWMGEHGVEWVSRGEVGWHFRGGMEVRNLLREGGFGEEELGIENLDFIYARLLERMVLGKELDREE